jgi:mono/diheme cytochrome c family protein
MRKFFRVFGYALLILILIMAALLTYIKIALPRVGPAPTLTFEYTPDRIERGRYLANTVTVCVDCHSSRDWSKFAGPVIDGTIGKGGERFDQSVGFPGVYYSKNITPAGIARYTDGELFRLITTGVTKEGRAMFPVMPYAHYGQMDSEDIKSIISYVRSFTPIENQVQESVSDFPMNFIINTIPSKASPQKLPPKSDLLGYGAYMANASGCIECHTPVKRGQIIPELAFSGGREFKLKDGSIVRSSNITPDVELGIGAWTEEIFTSKFKAFADSAYKPQTVSQGQFNSIMPWNMYCHMTKEDLAAIYAYIKTVKPVKNKVVKFTAMLNAQ